MARENLDHAPGVELSCPSTVLPGDFVLSLCSLFWKHPLLSLCGARCGSLFQVHQKFASQKPVTRSRPALSSRFSPRLLEADRRLLRPSPHSPRNVAGPWYRLYFNRQNHHQRSCCRIAAGSTSKEGSGTQTSNHQNRVMLFYAILKKHTCSPRPLNV